MTSPAARKPTRCPILAQVFRRKGGKLRRLAIIAAVSTALQGIAACHSYHVDSTIENQTGTPIQLLEVDYPSASFGADSIAAGANLHYRFVIHGSGPLKLSYTGADQKQVQITGPELSDGEQGQLRIELLPGGKAQFLPNFAPAR